MQDGDPASLSRLHDIVVAEPVSPWPAAPGWYALAMVFVLALVAFLWWRVRRWRADAYRRSALAMIEDLARSGDWSGLPAVVKRTALSVFSRAAVAGLSGADWCAFLDRSGGTSEFSAGRGRPLMGLAHDPRAAARLSATDAEALVEVCAAWVRDHSTARLGDSP